MEKKTKIESPTVLLHTPGYSISKKVLGEQYNFVKDRAKHDYFYFTGQILNRIGDFHLIEAPHFHQMFNLYLGDFSGFDLWQWGKYRLATSNPYHNRKLAIVPREHGKTKFGTIGMSMWWLLRDPNLRILVVSQTGTNAVDMLIEIRSLYEAINDNTVLKHIMGDWVGKRWSALEGMVVKPRTLIDKTPSLRAAGIDKEITSQHYHIIICDDLVGKENIGTLEQIEKVKRNYARLSETGMTEIDSETLFWIVGTPWHFSDLYSEILDMRKLGPMYDVLHLACWVKDEDSPMYHKPLFPMKFTKEALELKKKEKFLIDPQQWYAQWETDPIPRSAAVFNPEFYQYYTPDELPTKDIQVVICVDTATTEKKWSDYTAIVPVLIDRYGRRFVLPYVRFKESDSTKIAAQIVRMAKPWYNKGVLTAVGIEEGDMYDTYYNHIMKFARWMPLTKLKHHNQEKTFRIVQNLQIHVMTRRVYIMKNMIELIEQMIKFPYYNERDILDALAYHNQIIPAFEPEFPDPESTFPTDKEKFWHEVKVGAGIRDPETGEEIK